MSMAEDSDLIVALSSLETAPGNKDNWVEKTGPGGHSGSLPAYIQKIAKALIKDGKSKSTAIAIAISRCKAWAAGGGNVDADTKAKAAKAVAQWEAMKAKSKGNKIVKASATDLDGESYVFLAADSFNVDAVRRAWDDLQRAHRDALRAAARAAGRDPYESSPYSYIRELWTDHIIVELDGDGPVNFSGSRLLRVDYTVSEDGLVTFSDPVRVKQVYVDEESGEAPDDELSEGEKVGLSDVLNPAAPELDTAAEIQRLIALSAR